MANWLQIFRLVSFGFAIFCGIIVAALAAAITAFAEDHFKAYYIYAALAIATGGLTVITLPIMLVIDFLRRGAFTSWVLIELVWLFVLWVLWLATGALAVNNTSAIFTTCDFVADWANQLCRETQAIEAFSFLAWLTLMAYTITLLVVSLISQSRGQALWKLSVREYAALPPSQSSAFSQNPGALPPQQFQQQQQQQPLMAMSPAPQQQQPIYQQPYQNGSGFTQPQQQPQPQAQYPPPQPAPSPSAISQASYGTQGQQPQQAYGQPAYPQV